MWSYFSKSSADTEHTDTDRHLTAQSTIKYRHGMRNDKTKKINTNLKHSKLYLQLKLSKIILKLTILLAAWDMSKVSSECLQRLLKFSVSQTYYSVFSIASGLLYAPHISGVCGGIIKYSVLPLFQTWIDAIVRSVQDITNFLDQRDAIMLRGDAYIQGGPKSNPLPCNKNRVKSY